MKAFLTKSLEKTLKFLKEAKVEVRQPEILRSACLPNRFVTCLPEQGDATKGVLSDACQLLLNSAEQNLELLPRSIRRMLALLQLRINDKFGRSSGYGIMVTCHKGDQWITHFASGATLYVHFSSSESCARLFLCPSNTGW